jgi:hypothetical protein
MTDRHDEDKMAFLQFCKRAKKWTEITFYVISQEEISKQWKSERSQTTHLHTN